LAKEWRTVAKVVETAMPSAMPATISTESERFLFRLFQAMRTL